MMYSEKFCLQWNDHSKILVSLLHEFLGKECFLDVTLAAEGHLLRVHRLILCACSPYFEAMLSKESEKHAIVYMKDVKFEDLKALVSFMYKGEVTVVQEQLASFMSTAECLQIKGLANKESQNTSQEIHSKLPKVKTYTKSHPSHLKTPVDIEKSTKKSNGIPSEASSSSKIHNRAQNAPLIEIPPSDQPTLPVASNLPLHTPRSDYIPEPQQTLDPPPPDSDLFIAVEAKMETDAEDEDPDNIQVESSENEWPFREATDDWANNSNNHSLPVPYSETSPANIQTGHNLIETDRDDQAGPSTGNSQMRLSPADSEALLMATPPGSKSFACRLCSYHTDRKFNLKLHLRRKHKMAI